jgi:hypothetical protein
VTAFTNIVICTGVADLPTGPCMVVANGAKWSWLDAHHQLFDLQIVDEAYQLPDFRFQLIAGLAGRQVLIGDPGQIEPVIQSELERWRCDPTGPHIAAPRALIERFPDTIQMSLPVSRRLVQDTISFVQPAFYPEMAFEALEPARPIWFNLPGIVPVDTPMDAAATGQSLVMIELPAMMAGDTDPELAEEMVETARRVVGRQAMIVNREGQPAAVTPQMIGIACAQVSQVNAIRERLGPDLADVFVETANRFQGLEREIMFVQPPLSGRADATGFHLDAGRLCVLLSRHRVACWLFGRAGIRRQLQRYAPLGERSLGIAKDPEFEGWRANLNLMIALESRARIYSVPGRVARRRQAV